MKNQIPERFSVRIFGRRHSAMHVVLLAGLSLVLATQATSATDRGVPEIIVKYESRGPHAVEDCAERISTSGIGFERQTRDRSDSLDRLVSRYRLGRQRALFRKASSAPLSVQRRALRTRWKQSAQRFLRGRNAQRHGVDEFPDLAHVYRVEVPAGIRTNDLIADLNADPHVAYAQLNHGMDLDQAFVPDDPLFSSFGSWGQTFRDLWGPDRIHVPEVWSRSQGEGTVVAVVDTGLDALHPDIVGNVWINEGEDLDGKKFSS